MTQFRLRPRATKLMFCNVDDLLKKVPKIPIATITSDITATVITRCSNSSIETMKSFYNGESSRSGAALSLRRAADNLLESSDSSLASKVNTCYM